MRRLLLVVLGALLLGAAGIWLVEQDQGYVLLSLGNTTVEMSFWLAAIILVVSSLVFIWLLLLLRWVLGAGGVKQWWHARRANKQASNTARGLRAFLLNDWQIAQKVLYKSSLNQPLSGVSLLFSAKAAANLGQLDEARLILSQFHDQYPDQADYADTLLAEWLIASAKFDEAKAMLVALNNQSGRSLQLLSLVYSSQSDWSALYKILPQIKRQVLMDKDSLAELQVNCYCGLLSMPKKELPASARAKKVQTIWSEIPRHLRQNPTLICAYAQALGAANEGEKALSILSKALKNQWQQSLVDAFGTLKINDATKQLALGENWLIMHPNDAQLLLALGRICRHMGFLGKAKDYLKTTLSIRPSAIAYAELAEVLALLGDSAGSSETYRQGLLASVPTKSKSV
jgi:HemY protein